MYKKGKLCFFTECTFNPTSFFLHLPKLVCGFFPHGCSLSPALCHSFQYDMLHIYMTCILQLDSLSLSYDKIYSSNTYCSSINFSLFQCWALLSSPLAERRNDECWLNLQVTFSILQLLSLRMLFLSLYALHK